MGERKKQQKNQKCVFQHTKKTKRNVLPPPNSYPPAKITKASGAKPNQSKSNEKQPRNPPEKRTEPPKSWPQTSKNKKTAQNRDFFCKRKRFQNPLGKIGSGIMPESVSTILPTFKQERNLISPKMMFLVNSCSSPSSIEIGRVFI